MDIILAVKGEKTKIITPTQLNMQEQQVQHCIFRFDNEWYHFKKIARFGNGNITPIEVMLENDKCVIPWEVLSEKGTMYISVIGIVGNKRFTTNTVYIKVNNGMWTGEVAPSEATLTLQERIVLDVEKFEQQEEERKKTLSDIIKQEQIRLKAYEEVISEYDKTKEILYEKYPAASLQAQLSTVREKVRQYDYIIQKVDTALGDINISMAGFQYRRTEW